MSIPVLLATFHKQENASTCQAWVVRTSSSSRPVIFAEPTIDSRKRCWSHVKFLKDLGPKLELTCLVTGVIPTSSVWITTPRFGRLIFLRTHSQQQWSRSRRPSLLGMVFQKMCVSDNGSPFISDELKEFSHHWGFAHVTGSPAYLHSNRKVGAAVKSAKAVMKKI